MALPRPRRSLMPPPPPTLTTFVGPWPRRIVLWGGSAVVMVTLFRFLAERSLIRPPAVGERPPPEPRFFELVPADLMTTKDGLTLEPGERHLAADAALKRGDLATATAGYTELLRVDPRDRYTALMLACCAIEQDDFAAADTSLRRAAAPQEPAASPFRSLRALGNLVQRRLEGDRAPLLELWLRAVVAPDPPTLTTLGRDPLRDQFERRLLAAELVDPTPEEIAQTHGAELARDFALLLDAAPLAPARELLALAAPAAAPGPEGDGGDDFARELLALRRLIRAGDPADAVRIEEALVRRSALERDNGLYELLRARQLAPAALATAVLDGAPEPTLATEHEADTLPPLSAAAAEALAEAARRPRIDAHVGPLLAFEARVRRAAGDRFAPLHVTAATELLFLGDPRLRDRITYRALVADTSLPRSTQLALLEAAVALAEQQGTLACDPRRVQASNDHREQVRGLLTTATTLRLDSTALAARLDRFAPLLPLAPELRGRFEEAWRPPPIPRLVDELFARYAADLPALGAALKRYASGG